jgi:hypothetical protein
LVVSAWDNVLPFVTWRVGRAAWLLAGSSLVLTGAHCPPTTRGRAEVPSNADFVPVGQHPGAAAQPTPVGRMVATLFAWKGRLYAGYGDINANTGPIAVSPYDPGLARFVLEWVADTEAIYLFRAVEGRLFAPAIDPKNRADFSVGFPWRDQRPVDAYHVFDVATLTGTDLWLVGSRGLDAVAWRSFDGVRWEESLRIRTRSGSPDQLARFYFAGVFDGRLYVQARESPGGPQPMSQVFDGAAWREAPSLLSDKDDLGWRPVSFAGKLVYQSTAPVWGVSRLLAFDGAKVVSVIGEIYDFAVDGRRLFVLGADGAVRRTSDLASWTRLATAPVESRSLGALGGWLYVGTTDAELLRSRRKLY